jgi:four helix bundle protein
MVRDAPQHTAPSIGRANHHRPSTVDQQTRLRKPTPPPHHFHLIRDYRDLRVWIAAMDLAQAVYVTTAAFPRTERFGLTAQLRRAAVSVPSNIAEGQVRDSNPDFLRFLAIAAGSLAEMRTQLLVAARLQYTAETHEAEIDELARQIAALRAAVKRAIDQTR